MKQDTVHSYEEESAGKRFLSYALSENGQQERKLLQKEIFAVLEERPNIGSVVDFACGDGWLSGALSEKGYTVCGCDISPYLIAEARRRFPNIDFCRSDGVQEIPFDRVFDALACNMSAHDFSDMEGAFLTMAKMLAEKGTLIVTIANPYYSYPVGVWKRGFWGRVFRHLPTLRIRPYNFFRSQEREHVWNSGVPSYFRTLPEYIRAVHSAGFVLRSFEEVNAETDSMRYDRVFQMYRFPMIFLMVFEKREIK